MSIKIHGQHDQGTIDQLNRCVDAVPDARGVLCADGHLGYSCPIGGVVAYRGHVSPSACGYDVGCGNLAVRTNLHILDIESDLPRLADEIAAQVSFGMGRKNEHPVDHPVLDRIATSDDQRTWVHLAASQLGTVGSGNHYVDVLVDHTEAVWVACHFGSRGFGHKTASLFMNLAQGLPGDGAPHQGEMHSPPLLIPTNTQLGQDYIRAMHLAGDYASAGRDVVVQTVLTILGASEVERISNHHNFAWREDHGGIDYWVHRKGSTPLFPNQRGFVGGSMDDICVVLEGVDSPDAADSLYSTVHGAGRVMSRNQAIKGRYEWRCACGDTWCPPRDLVPKDLKCTGCRGPLTKTQVSAPVDFGVVRETLDRHGIILRGAGPDEAPEVYRSLVDVLAAHATTCRVVTVMCPRIVVMAGKETRDDYKD